MPVNLAAYRYPERWPPHMNIRILTLDVMPMIVFIGALVEYEKLEDWASTKRVLISHGADYKDVLVFQHNDTDFVVCQESTELVAFGPTYTASQSEGVLEVRNAKNDLVAVSKETSTWFVDAFFWGQDFVLVDEMCIFIVDHSTGAITEDIQLDCIGRAWIEDGKLQVRMYNEK